MIKAVNIQNITFKTAKGSRFEYTKGFAMMDAETGEFFSYDGIHPYVLERKWIIQTCIDGEWYKTMKRIKIA